jgi:hypothetical protein
MKIETHKYILWTKCCVIYVKMSLYKELTLYSRVGKKAIWIHLELVLISYFVHTRILYNADGVLQPWRTVTSTSPLSRGPRIIDGKHCKVRVEQNEVAFAEKNIFTITWNNDAIVYPLT